ncbi:hypothetical protein KAK06_17320 [Ideonella sp. 4Y11]|uniref:Uncharacterized protein n=1 Tax=Ideonella aquatica TaxID=2824119 RepID=A0A941BMD6_9BURK|nr:hypothetical protein [Ideonella aquatica]MBQ0960719.1 hypothetical protein [Ideonella aquatica]
MSTPVAAEASESATEGMQASAPASPVTVRTVRTVRLDLHDFMHALVQAARNAYAAMTASRPAGDDTAAAGSPTPAPGAGLAIGLTVFAYPLRCPASNSSHSPAYSR